MNASKEIESTGEKEGDFPGGGWIGSSDSKRFDDATESEMFCPARIGHHGMDLRVTVEPQRSHDLYADQDDGWIARENRRFVMEFDRNRYFMFGIILFLLGVQFRIIDSFVLNESSTRALHRIAKRSQMASSDVRTDMYMSVAPSPKKAVTPPSWLGWVLLTTGGVVCLHAMILPKRK